MSDTNEVDSRYVTIFVTPVSSLGIPHVGTCEVFSIRADFHFLGVQVEVAVLQDVALGSVSSNRVVRLREQILPLGQQTKGGHHA